MPAHVVPSNGARASQASALSGSSRVGSAVPMSADLTLNGPIGPSSSQYTSTTVTARPPALVTWMGSVRGGISGTVRALIEEGFNNLG